MDNSLKNLETDLKNAARNTDPDDKFEETMGEFSQGSKPCPGGGVVKIG